MLMLNLIKSGGIHKPRAMACFQNPFFLDSAFGGRRVGVRCAQWLSDFSGVFVRAKSGKMPDLTGWKPVPPEFENTP